MKENENHFPEADRKKLVNAISKYVLKALTRYTGNIMADIYVTEYKL